MPAREQSPKPVPVDLDQALAVKRDHEAIARLADDLLPALIAKLAASGLGEIEVREGGWKARLRMPTTTDEGRKSAGQPAESHSAHDYAPARVAVAHSRPDERHPVPSEAADEPGRIVAKSPAVGIYQPRRDLAVGMRVRSGDRIGAVNVLGVNQDVVSPVDGIIGSSLAETGEAVEYGQELVRIELPESTPASAAGRSEREPTSVAGNAS
jgi:biotin carboxyl carrier protein